ncbi:MAG: hypothetical protein Q4D81_01020 [Eubacteriales bacterium]|nr:hypothetical protein [Eubacteriales bacterium]
MRILITDENLIWTPDHPALEPYAEMVLVVCLNGERVTDKYECFISPYAWDPGALHSCDINDAKYAALENAADALNQKLSSRTDIVLLADITPASLYPFLVLRNRNRWNRLHLCAVSPRGFMELENRDSAYGPMMHDLTSLCSLFYMNSRKLLRELGPGAELPDLIRKVSDVYEELLPRILFGIQRGKWDKAFFDFYTKSYIPLEDGYDMIESALQDRAFDPAKILVLKGTCLLGMPMLPDYPNSTASTLADVESPVPRPDGKAVCNYLRSLRLQLAAANHIPFTSEECPTSGPCAGTCGKCDREASWLFEKMREIPPEKRVYPERSLESEEELP